MPFDPDSSSPSNPYKRGERAGLALAFFFFSSFGQFLHTERTLSGARDPKLTAEAFCSR